MKFTKLTRRQRAAQKREKSTSWHKWFAWQPVRLTTNENTVVWLESVYRKSSCPGGTCPDCTGCWNYATDTLDVLKIDK